MDRYSVVRELQNGLFGLVSLATDRTTNTDVCVKRVRKRRIAEREIEMLRRIGPHPGVCQLLDHFVDGDATVLVLERCVGDVYDLVHERDLTNDECVRLAQDIGAAVAHAHAHGVYHRDIKPENILYDQWGRFKLCDWGLATTSLVTDDMNVGTEKYMAPEMFDRAAGGFNDAGEYNAAHADYWGLGITMLTAIYGTAPFKPTTVADANYRAFVLLPLVLYDIYPNMNAATFETFTTTLVVAEPAQRLLADFVAQFELKLAFGFTIDDYDDVLDTDVFDNEFSRAPTTFDALPRDDGFDNTLPTLILLVKLTKLWCDMDADDDLEFHQQIDELFHKLGAMHVR